MSRPTIYLVDGFALAYRAFFAMIRSPLVNARGQNVSGVWGVTHALLDVIEKHDPDHLGFVLDKGRTFRHDLYPEYKATRAKMPDELRDQLDLMRGMVEAMGIPVLEREGFEADDLMGTLAREAETAGLDVYLVTGDKDFFQLVTDHTWVLTPSRGGAAETLYDASGVEAKFGVQPEHVTTVLALAGDSSDNVPGVAGVGPKTAIKLVREHGGVEQILAAADGISGKLGERLREHADTARLSLKLVIIDRFAPVELDLPSLEVGGRDDERLRELALELDSRTLMERLGVAEDAGLEWDFQIVDSVGELVAVAEQIAQVPWFALDTETTGVDSNRATLVGISFSSDGSMGYYVPIAHGMGSNVSLQEVKDVLGPILADPTIGKVGQNLKYDLNILERAGLPVAGVVDDTMVASYLVDPGSREHNLDFLSLKHLGHRMIPLTSLIGEKKSEQITLDLVTVEETARYAAEDAVVAHHLREVFRPRLDSLELTPLYETVEMPLVPVLARMERRGIAIDTPLLARLSNELSYSSAALQEKIYEACGREFNTSSPKQLQVILYEELGLKPGRKTKTGFSTDARELERLASEHEVPRLILENRELVKLRNTYVDALPRLIHPKTGRIHTSFHQAVTATGRLSSSDPNLQNIPIRTPAGREIRKAFIPGSQGQVLLSADYSQVELRVLAHLCGDERLRDAFANEEDIHSRTASLVFGVPLEDVDADTRRRAKEVNFGIIYGMGPFGLSSRLGISMEEAAGFIRSYFDTFPKIREFIDQTLEETRERSYVTTLLMRRRNLPEIHDSNRQVREYAERQAVNTVIQGTAADIIKMSMIRIDERMDREGHPGAMLLQVHDELVFEVPEADAASLSDLVRGEMSRAAELSVPLRVDVGVGGNWLEAH